MCSPYLRHFSTKWPEILYFKSAPTLVGLIKPIGLNSILAHNSAISKPHEPFYTHRVTKVTIETDLLLIFFPGGDCKNVEQYMRSALFSLKCKYSRKPNKLVSMCLLVRQARPSSSAASTISKSPPGKNIRRSSVSIESLQWLYGYRMDVPVQWQRKRLHQFVCLFVCFCGELVSAPLLNTLAISLFQCSCSAMAKKQTPSIDRPLVLSYRSQPEW